MSQFILLCIIVGIICTTVTGECEFGNNYDNTLSSILNGCPPLLYPSKTYCCISYGGNGNYCCDKDEFIEKNVYGLMVPGISILIAIFGLILCCVSCLCCTCCPWYRRRHPGRVYGPDRVA